MEPNGITAGARVLIVDDARELILRALAQADGNRAAAAKALGLHEKYFLRLIKSLRIS